MELKAEECCFVTSRLTQYCPTVHRTHFRRAVITDYSKLTDLGLRGPPMAYPENRLASTKFVNSLAPRHMFIETAPNLSSNSVHTESGGIGWRPNRRSSEFVIVRYLALNVRM